MKKISYLATILTVCGLCACASTKVDTKNMSAEELYNYAYKLLEETHYKKSAETFEQLELEEPQKFEVFVEL